MKKFLEPEIKLIPLVIQDEITNGIGGIDQYGTGFTGSGIELPEQPL